jgi:2-haloacid dehalogenase
MSRRDFLQLAGGVAAASVLAACGPGVPPSATAPSSAAPRARRKIRAICFDLFTLFDPRSVEVVADGVVPGRGKALCEAWRGRHFQYAFLRASAGQYVDFRQVTEEALVFGARSIGVSLSLAERQRLVGAYSELEPWPDARGILGGLRAAGLRLAPLANYAPSMLDRLLDRAALGELFEARISTDAARTYKPDPRAYALGVETLGLPREQITFAAFGGWDAAGARWFGYPTFWVNRLGVPPEELAPAPDGTGPSLAELAAFVSGWA